MPLLEASTDLHLAWVLATAAAAAVGLVFARTKLFVTLVHEAGHAIVSIVVGGGFSGIRVHADGGGDTEAYAHSSFRFALIAAAGYIAPGAAGVAGAWAYDTGRTAIALAVLAAITAVVLVFARSVHTVAVTLVFGAASGAAFFWGTDTLQAVALLAVAWTLLLGGVLDAVYAILDDGTTDAAVIQKHIGVPSGLTGILFLAANLWFVWAGGRILLGL